ncbi:MAG TPA: acyl-CoA carboxylase subunit epsilon [Acidimicrobiia bacterium]
MSLHLRVIEPDASPEEVAAIVAALTVAQADTASEIGSDDTLHEWVHVSRLRSHRSTFQRGPWRLSGRIGRRTRA